MRSLASHCKLLGHPSTTVTLDSPQVPWGADWHSPLKLSGPGWTHYGWSPHLAGVLEDELSHADFAVVHGLWQYHTLAARNACRSQRVPYIVCPHGMLDPWALRQNPAKRLLKSINWALVTRPVLKGAAAICFTTDAEKVAASPRLQGVSSLQCVAPLGVEGPIQDVSALARAWRHNHPDLAKRRVLLFLGRLHPKKGPHLLIEGFARWSRQNPAEAHNFHLRFAGPADSDQYLASLHSLGEHQGLRVGDTLSFSGMLQGDSKWQELAAADVMILPSQQENFGLVVGEALACSVPVLLSNKVNTAPWVTQAGAGFSASPTVDGVVELLSQWTSLSAEAKSTMRRCAHSLYESAFSPATAALHFVDTLQELLPPA